MNPHGYIVVILIILSSLCFGQEVDTDSASVDSTAYLTTAYDALADHHPQLDLKPLFIRIFWSVFYITLMLLFWRYLIRPLLMLVFNALEYRDQIIVISRLILILLIIYFIVLYIFQPSETMAYIIFAAVVLSISIGAYDFMRNIISGLSILIRGFIKPGDKIRVGETTGKVLWTGLQTTQVEDSDGTALFVPNYQFDRTIIHKQAMNDGVVAADVYFYLPPDIDIVRVKEIAHRAASLSRFVYLNKAIDVNLSNEFSAGRSIIKLCVSAYVLNIDYLNQFKSDITEIVLSEIISKNIVSPEAVSFGEIRNVEKN